MISNDYDSLAGFPGMSDKMSLDEVLSGIVDLIAAPQHVRDVLSEFVTAAYQYKEDSHRLSTLASQHAQLAKQISGLEQAQRDRLDFIRDTGFEGAIPPGVR